MRRGGSPIAGAALAGMLLVVRSEPPKPNLPKLSAAEGKRAAAYGVSRKDMALGFYQIVKIGVDPADPEAFESPASAPRRVVIGYASTPFLRVALQAYSKARRMLPFVPEDVDPRLTTMALEVVVRSFPDRAHPAARPLVIPSNVVLMPIGGRDPAEAIQPFELTQRTDRGSHFGEAVSQISVVQALFPMSVLARCPELHVLYPADVAYDKYSFCYDCAVDLTAMLAVER